MPSISEQTLALSHLSKMMESVAHQVGRFSVFAETGHSRLSDVTDLGRKTVEKHMLVDAIFGRDRDVGRDIVKSIWGHDALDNFSPGMSSRGGRGGSGGGHFGPGGGGGGWGLGGLGAYLPKSSPPSAPASRGSLRRPGMRFGSIARGRREGAVGRAMGRMQLLHRAQSMPTYPGLGKAAHSSRSLAPAPVSTASRDKPQKLDPASMGVPPRPRGYNPAEDVDPYGLGGPGRAPWWRDLGRIGVASYEEAPQSDLDWALRQPGVRRSETERYGGMWGARKAYVPNIAESETELHKQRAALAQAQWDSTYGGKNQSKEWKARKAKARKRYDDAGTVPIIYRDQGSPVGPDSEAAQKATIAMRHKRYKDDPGAAERSARRGLAEMSGHEELLDDILRGERRNAKGEVIKARSKAGLRYRSMQGPRLRKRRTPFVPSAVALADKGEVAAAKAQLEKHARTERARHQNIDPSIPSPVPAQKPSARLGAQANAKALEQASKAMSQAARSMGQTAKAMDTTAKNTTRQSRGPLRRGGLPGAPGGPPGDKPPGGAGAGGGWGSWFYRTHKTGEHAPEHQPWFMPGGQPMWGGAKSWSGMGKSQDPMLHQSPEPFANFFVQKMLKHGRVDADLIAQYNASLMGGEMMPDEKMNKLIGQSRRASQAAYETEGGEVIDPLAISDEDRRNMDSARQMAKDKHGKHAKANRNMKEEEQARKQNTQTLQASTDAQKKEKLARMEAYAEFGTFFSRLFKRGLIGGANMMEASSPDAYATMSGSFKLLAAVMGKELMPTMVTVADYTQWAARGFDKLHPAIKKTIVVVGALGMGLSAITLFAPQLYAAGKIIQAAAQTERGARWGNAAWSATKTGLKAAAVYGGAAAVGGGLGYAASNIGDYNKKLWEKAAKQSEEMAWAPTEKQFRNSPQYQFLRHEDLIKEMADYRHKGIEKPDFVKRLQEFRAESGIEPWKLEAMYSAKQYPKSGTLTNPRHKDEQFYVDPSLHQFIHDPSSRKKLLIEQQARGLALQQRGNKHTEQASGIFPTLNHWLTPGPESTRDVDEKAAARYKSEGTYLVQISRGVRDWMEKTPPDKRQTIKPYMRPENIKKNQDDLEELSTAQMLLDYQSRTTPQFMGIEDLGRKIQLEALAESPLQTEIRRIQQEQLNVLLEMSGNLKKYMTKDDQGNAVLK